MSGEADTRSGATISERARVHVPLNSKRLTAGQLRRLAVALGVPSSGSPADVRLIIEGKLTELGREPQNVQVVMEEGTPTAGLRLQDESGTFVTVEAEEPTHPEELVEEPVVETDGLQEDNDEDDISSLRQALEEVTLQKQTLEEEVEGLKQELGNSRSRITELWKMSCTQVQEYDRIVAAKDDEITKLRSQISNLSRSSLSEVQNTSFTSVEMTSVGQVAKEPRRGRAPPIDTFSGENPDIRFDDWLPALDRVRRWNDWSKQETLLQLAGYLRGRALQEWSLLSPEEQKDYDAAVKALSLRLDQGSLLVAVQDFRHVCQKENETVTDYIRRLERCYQLAYGRDKLTAETKEAILFGQLQAGLSYQIVKSPAVSGSQSYKGLCAAANAEEKRIVELRRRQHYQRSSTQQNPRLPPAQEIPQPPSPNNSRLSYSTPRKCYMCGSTKHLARKCPQGKQESMVSGSSPQGNVGKKANMVRSVPDPMDFLQSSDSEDGNVCVVRVQDKGSKPRTVTVDVQGVPAKGIIDSGADITIMNGQLFQKVAAVAHLKKRSFKKPDRVPFTYDHKPFALDGKVELDITFDGKTMTTAIYIKMDSQDPLLLSEGVCHQLGIISYHPLVEDIAHQNKQITVVPSVRVQLIHAMRLLPLQCATVPVQLEGNSFGGPILIEPGDVTLPDGITVADSVISSTEGGHAQVLLTNSMGFTQQLEAGIWLGHAIEATIMETAPSTDDHRLDSLPTNADHTPTSTAGVRTVTTQDVADRKRKLGDFLSAEGASLQVQDRDKLFQFLLAHHDIFAIDEGDRGETDLVQMTIDTGEAQPKRVPPRRTPMAAKQEIATQLQKMQDQGVIQPSSSPWASPVVLVRKKDGTMRFCIDYRQLNKVTKPDVFPLPRIVDLLDQLGKAQFFSTLDLAAGYWQVQMHPDSREKTAFTTNRGLFEFRVMPFGLRNAPAVFQRLMQHLLSGLNPPSGPDFVSAYLDDILVFSPTLEAHLDHLHQVLTRLSTAGLKLKPTKCHFIRQQVEYLGHVITPKGIKPNPDREQAVRDFPTPRSLKDVRAFIGLASYYRRFIKGFAQIAQPLHSLTRKGAIFVWTQQCQEAFDQLKERLVTSPLLAYPTANQAFMLETDASNAGLGAVLSQIQSDGKEHPVAYASRALSPQETRYAITELETLAVVWAITHFHAYLYGHDVEVVTDHSAVQAVLQTPSANGKHARWWSKIFGSGLNTIKIRYRPGKDNCNADGLSRCPVSTPPQSEFMSTTHVAMVHSTDTETINHLLNAAPCDGNCEDFAVEQGKDPELTHLLCFLQQGKLPDNPEAARKVAAQAPLFTLADGILYFINPKQRDRRQCVVPVHLRKPIMEEHHSSPMAGHFSGERLYKVLSRHWWWQGMYGDILAHCRSCPQCAIVNASGKINKPPLHPIPVERVFQIMGVDIMDLPLTDKGNRHVVVFQDFLSKWPLVFPVPDQKAERLARLLVDEVVPFCGVPEALLSDRGANLLSHLMTDVCNSLGIKKLNTTAYHPQCDGMVERFNRTLKTILRKHADTYGRQWDRYLPGVLWAYRNTPHEATGEKPSFLLFGMDCRTPSQAAYLKPTDLYPTDVDDYRTEMKLAITSSRKLAATKIQQAQKKYKAMYDKRVNCTEKSFQIGQWVLVHFLQDNTGPLRKLSRPWHGPYRITANEQSDVCVTKVYFPQDKEIRVHLSRVKLCPPNFPAGFYWYGGKKRGPGHPPKWVEQMMALNIQSEVQTGDESRIKDGSHATDHQDRLQWGKLANIFPTIRSALI